MERNERGWYPVWLNMEGVRCLVVGCGKLAERRIGGLLDAGACVSMIGPEATPRLASWADAGRIDWFKRAYAGGDLDACRPSVVFALTDDPDVNRRVREDAHAAAVWVNDGTDGAAGSLIVPAAAARGRLRLAVTTLGASPALASAVRRELEEAYGAEYEQLVDFLHDMRVRFERDVNDAARRAALNRSLLAYPITELIRAGEFPAWRLRAFRLWDEERRLP